MAKNLLLASDEMAIVLNEYGLVQSLTFPHVGSEQHIPGLVHKIGIWVDGRLSWLDDGSWEHKARYQRGVLAGHTVVINRAMGLLLEFDDVVASGTSVLARHIHVVNLEEQQRTVRLFLHQAFQIGGTIFPDTAQFFSGDAFVVHRGGRRVFVAGGATDVGQGPDQYSVGKFGNGLDGTWRDAEDGQLSCCDFETGMVDSTLRFSLTIGGLSSRRVNYWLVASLSVQAATHLSLQIKKKGLTPYTEATVTWWRKWLGSSRVVENRLSPQYRLPFEQTLMLVRSHIDRRGGIMTHMPPDAQSSCSPHAAAYAMWPLVRLGYHEDASNFFTFCRSSLAEGGFLRDSYNPDGSIGTTRLPSDTDPSIDSGPTAMVLTVFSHYYSLKKQPGLIGEYYESMIKPMANFLVENTDEHGLPYARCGDITTYTTATTYAALMTAADIAKDAHDPDSHARWHTTAEQMRGVAERFTGNNGLLRHSLTRELPSVEALFGAFMFGLYAVDDPIIVDSVTFLERAHRRDDGLFMNDLAEVDYVHSLWMAQYYMEVNHPGDALKIIDRVIDDLPLLAGEPHELVVRAELLSTLLDTTTR